MILSPALLAKEVSLLLITLVSSVESKTVQLAVKLISVLSVMEVFQQLPMDLVSVATSLVVLTVLLLTCARLVCPTSL